MSMSETPIIRLAAILYARSMWPNVPNTEPMFQDELHYFYQQHRSARLQNWTASFIRRANEAHAYMKEEAE